MTGRNLNIVQVSMFDRYGGAERVAGDLFQAYRARGHESWLAVGRKRTADAGVLTLPHHLGGQAWSRFWWRWHLRLQPAYGRVLGSRALCRFMHALAEPRGWWDRWRGIEDFHYPGAWQLLKLTPRRPDVIHAHNLHQKYFDLRALPWLSREVPVVLTLHDAWLLAGHCAHSFACERWKTGCGACPDLALYSPLRRDGTAENWRRKRDIYARSRLHVATPCRWLMDKVEQSMLMAGAVERRVIPYGVDLTVFRPGDQAAARARLGLPQAARVLMFAASGIRGNVWKDYQTLRAAVAQLGQAAGRWADTRLVLVALGETAPEERIGAAELRFVPFEDRVEAVATYYQAADVYVHAARADTFPNAVLEALACGTPVVATAVGGIPEQVRCAGRGATPEHATGVLTPPGDAEALAAEIERLLDDAGRRHRMGENAAADARAQFDLNREVDAYLDWYAELLGPLRASDRPRALAIV